MPARPCLCSMRGWHKIIFPPLTARCQHIHFDYYGHVFLHERCCRLFSKTSWCRKQAYRSLWPRPCHAVFEPGSSRLGRPAECHMQTPEKREAASESLPRHRHLHRAPSTKHRTTVRSRFFRSPIGTTIYGGGGLGGWGGFAVSPTTISLALSCAPRKHAPHTTPHCCGWCTTQRFPWLPKVRLFVFALG